jgi:hypothetical protein
MAKILNFPLTFNVAPVYSEKEQFALSLAKEIVADLTELETVCEDNELNGYLINDETGEVIDIDELCRVVGVLDGLLTTKKWTLR